MTPTTTRTRAPHAGAVRRPRTPARALALVPERGGASERTARAREIDRLLVRYVCTRDERTRDILVAEFLPLAHKLARRYLRSSEPTEDLMQVASLALLKAIERFDPGRGASFVSYAIPTILGELRRYFRDSTWALHVPRRAQERIQAVEACRERLTNAERRSPTVQRIAEELELSEEDVIDTLLAKRAYEAESLDAPRPGGEEDSGAEAIEAVGAEDPGFNRVDERTTVEPALDALTESERELLELRFIREMSQTQIAAELGVSQMQVSRLLAATIGRMRDVSGIEPAA
ncbi:MAG TPA: SigB/SigF/SigG family RNA polymerase sigma factor [Solirubrobacteraceae bacterium]|nr:SigB/SigF/SigG family RNA polymerase sigma factor [Solirubrobacteraceae bacterium]